MNKNHEKIGDLLTTLVFALFTLCLLLVLLGGAGVYRRVVDAGQRQFETYTVGQYLSTRVRQGHEIALEEFCGLDALTFREEFGGEEYITRVYCHEGYLWELYTPVDGEFSPEDGEQILELDALKLSLEQGVLTIDIGSDVLQLTLREGRQVRA